MGDPESATFYDQHPFDWVPIDATAEIDSVVSRPLVELIQTLDVNSLVLDIGCGPGRVLGFLKRRGIRCVGLDRSRVSLGLAIKRYDVSGAVGDNLHLPFADGIADVVISDGVIHHTEDPSGAFTENFRILKPGGRIGISDVVAEDHLTSEQRAARGSYVGCIADALSKSEYEAGLEAAGFEEVSVEFTHEVADGMHGAIVTAVKP